MSKDQSFTRGAAVAFLAIGVALPMSAQGTGPVPVKTRDSVLVRVIDSGERANLDSIRVWMRTLDGVPFASPVGAKLREQLEAMAMTLGSRISVIKSPGMSIMLQGPEGLRQFEASLAKGWIGLNTVPVPHRERWSNDGHFIRYFEHPAIMSVERNSPAQRAGIAPGDVLVAYDGIDIAEREINVTQMLVPDKKLAVTVRRDGESKDYTLVVAKAPGEIFYRRLEPGEPPPPMPDDHMMERMPRPVTGGVIRRAPSPPDVVEGSRIRIEGPNSGFIGPFFIDRTGVFGASLITLSPDLAKALNRQLGVLVQEVSQDAVAFKSGLRTGDVIISVAGQPVTRVRDVQSMVMARVMAQRAEHAVEFQVVRDKKTRPIVVKW